MDPINSPAEDAMIRHLADLMAIQQLSMPYRILTDTDSNKGTVLAVVNFPKTSGRDCNGIGDFGTTYQLRLDYDRVVAIGSTKIMDMFKPKKQEKFRRLLKMDVLPPGIDYVLDFTPPLEGEECSELTASLWLPAGTKVWWMAAHYKPSGLMELGPREGQLIQRPLANKMVAASLSLGHDDECPCSTTYSDISSLWAEAKDVRGIYHGDWVPPFRENIKDYCRVRHCMNVVRILRAIAGEHLLINSAPRMWTLAHLALYLDVVSVVRDSITQWFSATPNSKFIEMFPEESFNLALKLQMRDILLASFKILVNERAVDHAATVPLTKPPATTWMQRHRTDYGDLPEDPIEHASRAFADRMRAKLDSLRGNMAYQTMCVGEWDKLQYYGKRIAAAAAAAAAATAAVPLKPVLLRLSEKLIELNDALLHVLHDHVNESLYHFAGGGLGRLSALISAQRDHYCPPGKQTPTDCLVAVLNPYQKACLPFFWYSLKDVFPEYGEFMLRRYKQTCLSYIVEDFNDQLQYALSGGHLVINLDDFKHHLPAATPYNFDAQLFHSQLDMQLSLISLRAIGFRDGETDCIPLLMSDHLLLTLEESELKYLPLWAGGFDDGSGGVFQDEVPPTDMGPSEPGPHYHTGHTVASNTGDTDASSTVDFAPSTTGTTTTATLSDMGLGDLGLDDYTTARSVAAQDGMSTTVLGGRSRVVSLATSASEAFTSGDEASMAEAMFAVPAAHQAVGQAVAQYVEAVSDEGEQTGVESWDGGDDDDDEGMDTDSTLSLGGDYGDDEEFML